MITIVPLKQEFSLYQINSDQEIPTEIIASEFYSYTKTQDEISIVSSCTLEFDHLKSEKGWKGLKVAGILDFSLVGILHDLTKPLKENGISVFVLSTYNTDYLFTKADLFEEALHVLGNTENVCVRHATQ